MEYSYDIHRQKQYIEELNIQKQNIERAIQTYKRILNTSIYDLFQMYKKSMIETTRKDNKIHQDKQMEILSKTELFDMSSLGKTYEMKVIQHANNPFVFKLPEQIQPLPFENMFIKATWLLEDNINVITAHTKEIEPNIIEADCNILSLDFAISVGTYVSLATNTIQIFVINVNGADFTPKDYDLLKANKQLNNIFNKGLETTLYGLTHILGALNKLNQHVSLVDTSNKPEYYTFKDKTRKTVKVEARPIYYILDKQTYERKKYDIKPITKLEYSHAFRVRGHWRKIQDGNIGKDRSGVYRIQNYTWVIDHIRGEGELVKRLRIVK